MGEVGLEYRFEGFTLYFFGCNIFLFHTITITIRYAIVHLSANDRVIISSVDYKLKYNEL